MPFGGMGGMGGGMPFGGMGGMGGMGGGKWDACSGVSASNITV